MPIQTDLFRHQPHMGMVAMQVETSQRPWRLLDKKAFVEFPALKSEDERSVVHQSDVMFWSDHVNVSCCLNRLPIVMFENVAKFAGLAVETSNYKLDHARMQVMIRGRANVVNYNDFAVGPSMPLVMSQVPVDAEGLPKWYRGNDPQRMVACLTPAFLADRADSLRYKFSWTELPVTAELVYASMKVRGVTDMPTDGFPNAALKPIHTFC